MHLLQLSHVEQQCSSPNRQLWQLLPMFLLLQSGCPCMTGAGASMNAARARLNQMVQEALHTCSCGHLQPRRQVQ
jgi:hypothetical protein